MTSDTRQEERPGAPTKSPSQDHYLVLDGMRGVGAIIVVAAHGGFCLGWAPHSAFLLDFFFIMSGFVMAQAYERRLRDGSLSLARFFELRFIRLYPMIAFGMLAGALPVLAKLVLWYRFHHLENALFALGAGLVMIPLPPKLSGIPFSMSIYPYSLPSWSLFFECVSNVVYAFCVRWITPRRLTAIVILSGVGLADAILRNGGVSFGPYWPEMGDGFWRITFSFSLGLLLHHLRRNRRARPAGMWKWIFLAVLPAACCIPIPYHASPTPYIEMALVLILSPALVWFASRLQVEPRSVRLFEFLGRLSYPLYLSHWPIVVVVTGIEERLRLHGAALAAAVIFQVVAAVGVSIAVMLYFDEPVRRRLAALSKRRRLNASVRTFGPSAAVVS